MKLLTIFLLFITPTLFFRVKRLTLQGTVKDGTTGDLLIGANLLVGETGTVTEANGTYALYLNPGKYKLEISYIGYQKLMVTIEVKENDQITRDFSLEAEELLLQTTTVTSGRYEKPLAEVTVSLEVLKP
ncbi:MAG: carboxypeptidase-like regulatory domain-containing protein [Saprospiraceae bacterium]|nr:carboxypeptidase-like regulatory domain-containing protein [Saprospiraceae bacterium]